MNSHIYSLTLIVHCSIIASSANVRITLRCSLPNHVSESLRHLLERMLAINARDRTEIGSQSYEYCTVYALGFYPEFLYRVA